MSMLLFANTIHKAIRTTAEKHTEVQPLAYADDITLLGKPRKLAEAYRTLTEELQKVGCRCNPSKSQVLHRQNIESQCDELSADIGAQQKQRVIILGVPISVTHATGATGTASFSKWLDNFKHACTMVKNYAVKDAHGAMQLLFYSIQAKPGFIMQTSNTMSTASLAAFVDNQIQRVLTAIMQVDSNHLSHEDWNTLKTRSRLRIKNGGAGIRPWIDQRVIAYLSNFVNASHKHHSFSTEMYDNIKKYVLAPYGPVRNAMEALRKVKAFATLPEDIRKLINIPTKPEQLIGEDCDNPERNLDTSWRHDTTEQLFEAYNLAFKSEFCDESHPKAQQNHTAMLEKNLPAAGNWILASQQVKLFRLKTDDFAFTMRRWMELPLKFERKDFSTARMCPCGKAVVTCHHLLNCTKYSQFVIRHDTVRDTLKVTCEDYRYRVLVEQRVDDNADLRMDLICEDNANGDHLSVDVQVSTPATADHPRFVSEDSLAFWESKAIAIKNARYKHLVEDGSYWDTTFRIFLMSARGGISGLSHKLLKRLTPQKELRSCGLTYTQYHETLLNMAVIRRTAEQSRWIIQRSRKKSPLISQMGSTEAATTHNDQ